MQNPNDVLAFWLEEVGGPERWYKADPELDQEIRKRFADAWKAAKRGELSAEWTARPEGMLAFLILVDQFPRNMFRGTSDAFATDAKARSVAKKGIERRWDMRIPEPERQFFYLPLMHSECLCDQERCVRLMLTRMPESGKEQLLHAKAHREVIRRFGRFPYRNEALDRSLTVPEAEFLKDGGYVAAVREMAV